MASIELHEGEILLSNQFAIQIPGSQGRIHVTNQRIVWHNINNFIGTAFSFMSFAMKGRFEYDIPLNNISSISKTRWGLNKKVFTIHTNDGSKYSWAIHFDNYFKQITEVLSSQFGIELRESSEGVWEVI